MNIAPLRHLKSRRAWASAKTSVIAAIFAFCGSALSQVGIYTQRYDNARTGANLKETTLNTSNVNAGQFGRLFFRVVNGTMIAQPLIAPNVISGGKARTLLIVTTVGGQVMAFDAEDPGATDPLWKVVFPSVPRLAADLYGQELIATPVIDPVTNTLYVLNKTVLTSTNDPNGSKFWLHAMDLATGAEKQNSPIEIRGSVPGTGAPEVESSATFKPQYQNGRPGLLLLNGSVYVCFASQNMDEIPMHGWIMGYDMTTLTQTGIFCTTPNGRRGGIWMSGEGPVADDQGNIFFSTGNGTVSYYWNNYGNSVIKLSTTGGLKLADVWTAPNWVTLNKYDLDLGVSGLTFVPGTNHLVVGSKEGKIYLLDRKRLGGLKATDDTIPQVVRAGYAHVHGTPVFWKGPTGLLMYVWPEWDYLRAFEYKGTKFFPLNKYESPYPAPDGMPGGYLAISANGSTAGSGVLWSNVPLTGAGNRGGHGVLRAWDASNLNELWISNMNPQDAIGSFGHHGFPAVANGKVYVGTSSWVVNVYGLKGSTVPMPPMAVKAEATFGKMRVYWSETPNTNSYTILRAVLGGTFSELASGVKDASYIDTSVEPGKSYFYKVVAFNEAGQSAESPISSRRVALEFDGFENSLACLGDSYTRNGSFSADNYGTVTSFNVKGLAPGYGRRGYVKFDLTQFKGSVKKAFVRLFGNHQGTAFQNVSLYTVNGDWTEGTINWDNQPSLDKMVATTQIGSTKDWYSWDVTNLVTTLRASGVTEVTLAVVTDTLSVDGAVDSFISKESSALLPPILTVYSTEYSPIFNVPSFTSSQGLALSGTAAVTGSRLLLTNGAPKTAGTAFFTKAVNVSTFNAEFTFLLNSPTSDGISFTIQNSGSAGVLGGTGDSLGFGPDNKRGRGITKAFSIKFETNNSSPNGNATGFRPWMLLPKEGSIDLTPSGVNLKSGNIMKVVLSYDGVTLTSTITDTVTLQSATNQYRVNIPSVVASVQGSLASSAFIGFTGGSGAVGAEQSILSFQFSN